MRIRLPIYVELAHAEAKLADIRCYGGKPENAAVVVDAVPGVAEIAVGDVNPKVLSSFSFDARVERARIVDALAVKIDAIAHVEAQNLQASRLTFSPAEVAARSIKSVSTKDILSSTTKTLLNNLDLNIQVLFLTLGSPTILQQALAQTLAAVTKPVDDLLYNLLLLVGGTRGRSRCPRHRRQMSATGTGAVTASRQHKGTGNGKSIADAFEQNDGFARYGQGRAATCRWVE